ncbi:hypothetical protein C8R44DRAFT_738193 [Mycena epipterygia]|nr:hypothetical protein C8R44DRAFT_738193 [Mycena epipterygia]
MQINIFTLFAVLFVSIQINAQHSFFCNCITNGVVFLDLTRDCCVPGDLFEPSSPGRTRIASKHAAREVTRAPDVLSPTQTSRSCAGLIGLSDTAMRAKALLFLCISGTAHAVRRCMAMSKQTNEQPAKVKEHGRKSTASGEKNKKEPELALARIQKATPTQPLNSKSNAGGDHPRPGLDLIRVNLKYIPTKLSGIHQKAKTAERS